MAIQDQTARLPGGALAEAATASDRAMAEIPSSPPVVRPGGRAPASSAVQSILRSAWGATLAWIRRQPLLFQMIGLALLIHLLLLLVTVPGVLFHSESLDEIYARAQHELQAQHYAEAMELLQKVLDSQPKVPDIFIKAAEQHRLADQLARSAMPGEDVKPASPQAPAATPPQQPKPGDSSEPTLPNQNPKPPATANPKAKPNPNAAEPSIPFDLK